jgi:hypothetical protein
MTMFLVGLGIGLATLVVRLLPASMRRSLDREARRVHGGVAGASPGPDWPVLYARLRSREIGLVIGLSVGFPAYFLLASLGDAWLAPGIAALILPASVGALVGHLRSLRGRPGVPRVVSLHRRELVDYLAPSELWLARCAAAVPVAVAALAVAAWTDDPGDPAGPAVLSVCAFSLVVSLLAQPLARRTLLAPTGVSTPGGLVWAEVLRARMLRDIVSTCTVTAVATPGLALMSAVLRYDRPDGWWLPGCWLVAGLVGVLSLGRAWFDITDSGFDWARGHAVPEVA